MSKIYRYQESILKFILTKSPVVDFIKSDKNIENMMSVTNFEASIVLLTILNYQNKKKNIKSHHGYYMSSGINLMMIVVMLNDNMKYYANKFGEESIRKISNQFYSFVYECLLQNMESMNKDQTNVLKIQKNICQYLNKQILSVSNCDIEKSNQYVHKTDIITYKFENKNIIDTKYKKLKSVEKNILLEYVERTFGAVCRCSFVIGWLLGMGDEKKIGTLEKMGNNLGVLIKLTNDFDTLEQNIETSETSSLNLLVNLGIHECFDIFDTNKLELIEQCMTLDIYNTTLKEIINYLERKFDEKLKNADLDINSRYTSFSTR